MGRADVFSIWILPEGEVYDTLHSAIRQLSKPYGTPEFEPHITIIGTLTGRRRQITEKTARLAAMMEPFDVTLKDVDRLNEYFRCLFIRVEKTAAIMDANMKARSIFDQSRSADYMPHLSLMYGDIDTTVKKAIIKTIGNDLQCSFPAADIHLYSTTGAPENWHRVHSCHLGQRVT